MRSFFYTLRQRLQTFMIGRYGGDLLSKHINVLSMILLVVSWFWRWAYIGAVALLVWSIVRICSRNIYKRQRENQAYLNLLSKLKKRRNLLRSRWRDRRTHRFFKCPSCKEYLRVPKGRGNVHITCPRCRHEIERKT